MMKSVRNKARLMSTELGGVCCRPNALLRKDSTTIIRVNDVTIIRMEGARLKTVSRAISWMILLLVEPLPSSPKSIESCCVKPVSGMSIVRVASMIIKRNFIFTCFPPMPLV